MTVWRTMSYSYRNHDFIPDSFIQEGKRKKNELFFEWSFDFFLNNLLTSRNPSGDSTAGFA